MSHMILNFRRDMDEIAMKRLMQEEGIASDLLPLSMVKGKTDLFRIATLAVVSSRPTTSWNQSQNEVQYFLSDLRGVSLTMLLEANAKRAIPENNCEGLVILIMNPTSRINESGAFNLIIKTQRQLAVVGRVTDYAHCGALKQDGLTFCKMPIDKSQCEHCIYHANNSKRNSVVTGGSIKRSISSNGTVSRNNEQQGEAQYTAPTFSTTADDENNKDGYKTVNISMTHPTAASTNNSRRTETKVVALEVLPLGKRPLSADHASVSLPNKKTAQTSRIQIANNGTGTGNGNDLFTQALTKSLTLPHSTISTNHGNNSNNPPPRLPASTTGNTNRINTTGLAAAHREELRRGTSSSTGDYGENTSNNVDYGDQAYALRNDAARVSQLLHQQRSSGGSDTASTHHNKADALELQTVRNIIAKEKTALSLQQHQQHQQQQAALTKSTTDVHGVSVPGASTGVFAAGAEAYRQQLIDKENLLKSKLATLPNRNSSTTDGTIPTRQTSTLGRIGTTATTSTASTNSTNMLLARGVQSGPMHMSSAGVNKILRPASADSISATSGGANSGRLAASTSLNSGSMKMIGRTLVNTSNLMANAPAVAAASPRTNSNSNNSRPMTTGAISAGTVTGIPKGINLVTQILAQSKDKTISNNPANNQRTSSTSSSSDNTAPRPYQVTVAQQKTSLDSTIDALLNRKSINASSANDEWFESYSQRMNKLAQREYAQEQASSVHAVHIKAFQCHTCNLITETSPPLCRQNNHNVSLVTTVKQFFECGVCNKRDFTLGKGSTKVSLPPETRCTMCGNYNWRPCGQCGSGPLSVTARDSHGSSVTDLAGGKLVLSASEWTTRSDAVHMAARTSAL